MILTDSTLNAAIFVTTIGGFVKTACANTIVDGVLGLLILCMAAGFSYMASMRNREITLHSV